MGQSEVRVSSRLFWFAFSNITQSNAGANWRLFCQNIQTPESFSCEKVVSKVATRLLWERLLYGNWTLPSLMSWLKHLVAHLFCIFVVPHCRLIKPINPLIVQEPVSQGVHWSANLGRVCAVSVIATEYLPCPLKTGSRIDWAPPLAPIIPRVGRGWVWLSDVTTCQPALDTEIMSHVTCMSTSFVSNQSRHRETFQKCTVSDSALPPTVLNPCQYSCVCGMIPHFPVAPAGSTWLLVPPIQSRVPSVMFWLTSMSRRSPEYQVPHSALISSRLMTEAGARLLTWHCVMCHTVSHSDSRCAGVIASEFPQLAMI